MKGMPTENKPEIKPLRTESITKERTDERKTRLIQARHTERRKERKKRHHGITKQIHKYRKNETNEITKLKQKHIKT